MNNKLIVRIEHEYVFDIDDDISEIDMKKWKDLDFDEFEFDTPNYSNVTEVFIEISKDEVFADIETIPIY